MLTGCQKFTNIRRKYGVGDGDLDRVLQMDESADVDKEMLRYVVEVYEGRFPIDER